MARHTQAEAGRTRARLLDAALAAFAEDGVRATTLEGVAARAGVTRGAVYWHFADKAALAAEAIGASRWPLDIGPDVSRYRAHPQPLRLLRRQLVAQMAQCLNDPVQWRTVKLALQHGARAELPPAARARLEQAVARTVMRLGRVMRMAHARGQLRAGLAPAVAGRCLHAVGVGVLLDCAHGLLSNRQAASARCLELCLDLFLAGVARS
uniref:TetR family transcriptional regulator n=1 Tax=unclassified Variovorax TaxID=663243 RepID=UPI000D4227C0